MKTITTFLLFILISVVAFSANTAHVNWDKLDKPIKRGVWEWKPLTASKWDNKAGYQRLIDNYKNSQDLLIDFCKNKSINTIYVSIGCWEWEQSYFNNGTLYNESGIASLITKANAAGIRVWALFYLWDDPNNFTNYATAATKIVDAVAGYNSRNKNAGFDGIQDDTEPSNTAQYSNFILYCQARQTRVNYWKTELPKSGSKPFINSATLKPGWVFTTYNHSGSNREMFKHVVDACDHVALMNYQDTQFKLLEKGEPVLAYAASLNPVRPVAIGIETGWVEAAGSITYNEEIAAENNSTRFNRLETDLDAVEAVFNTYASYERIIIHDYPQYFYHWFQQEPAYWNDANLTWTVTGGFVNLSQDASKWAGWPNAIVTNNAPVITSSPTLTAKEGSAYTYTITATDADNDALTYSAPTKPTWLSFNATTRVLSGTPQAANVGQHSVVLQVSDGKTSTSQLFTITVASLGNNAPVITSTAITSSTQSVLYTYTITATDLDSDVLTYTAPTLPSWLTFNATTRVLSGTPNETHVGVIQNVILRVSDGKTTTDQSFTIVVNPASGTNLLPNPGFETQTSWDAWASTYTTSCKRSGSYGMALSDNEAGFELAITGLKANTKYIFRGYFNTANTEVTIGAKKFNGLLKAETVINTSSMQLGSVEFTTGNQTTATIFVYRFGNTTTVCVDDFELFESDVVSVKFENTVGQLSVFPNPLVGSLLHLESAFSGEALVSIYNVHGSLVQEEMIVFNNDVKSLNCLLNKGVYILSVKQQEKVQHVKFMVK